VIYVTPYYPDLWTFDSHPNYGWITTLRLEPYSFTPRWTPDTLQFLFPSWCHGLVDCANLDSPFPHFPGARLEVPRSLALRFVWIRCAFWVGAPQLRVSAVYALPLRPGCRSVGYTLPICPHRTPFSPRRAIYSLRWALFVTVAVRHVYATVLAFRALLPPRRFPTPHIPRFYPTLWQTPGPVFPTDRYLHIAGTNSRLRLPTRYVADVGYTIWFPTFADSTLPLLPVTLDSGSDSRLRSHLVPV